MITARLTLREVAILLAVIGPMCAYVFGALRFDWGFNELGGLLFFGGMLAGLVGGLRLAETVTAFLEGAQSLLPATMLIGLARSISLVLTDGQVIDTILHALGDTPRIRFRGRRQRSLMIPLHSIVHVPVPSVSGQAVLTMPILVPLADLLGLSRQVPVLAYQTGAGSDGATDANEWRPHERAACSERSLRRLDAVCDLSAGRIGHARRRCGDQRRCCGSESA